jgi:CspA family cold shock protein
MSAVGRRGPWSGRIARGAIVAQAQGTIKTMTDRGYGFIRPDDEGADIFFHRSALSGVAFEQLREGDRVTYTAEPDPRGKGRRAVDVGAADR